MAVQKCNYVPNVTSYHKLKTINLAYKFFLINAKYKKVGSFFFALILPYADYVESKCRKSIAMCMLTYCFVYCSRKFMPVLNQQEV